MTKPHRDNNHYLSSNINNIYEKEFLSKNDIFTPCHGKGIINQSTYLTRNTF